MAALLFAGATAGEAAHGPGRVDPTLPVVPGELIVGFAPGVSSAQREGLLATVGARGDRSLRRTRARLARVDPARLDAVLKRLRSDPRVAYAEPNYRLTALDTPNDSAFNQLWGLVNTGQTVHGTAGTADADIDAAEAWDVTTGSQSVVVGVIDTGVDFSHPDLGGSATIANPVMWTNPGETGGGRESNGLDDDANGYVDDWRGWDWVGDDNNPTDDHNHGTHVAGTIGARADNGIGVAGVSWNVRIMALKFLDAQGNGDLADAVEALRYATEMGARITNNSWGGGDYSQAMFDALEEADREGRLFVAAAGNSSADNDAVPSYPASYDVPNVVAVAASDQDDDLAWFSNRGATTVGLAAPGTNVYSTVRGGGYDWFDGTSMASPHVAGTAALGAAAFPQATSAGLKALLLRSVDAKSSLAGVTATGGRLNAARAVGCAGAPMAWLESPRAGFRAALGDSVPVTVIGTKCAEATGVTVTATANGTPIALTSRGDGVYTGSYDASTLGPVTITATATVGSLVDTRSTSGTVADEYRIVEEPIAWLDATAVGGTRLTLGDDTAAALALPFPFRFYDQTFTSVSVSSNGYLRFGPGIAVDYQNTSIPTAADPNALVAAYWDDLNPAAAGAVWHRTIGAAPNRKLVISWIGVPHYGTPGTVTFQVVLEESTGAIVLAYLDTDHGNGGLDHGTSSTVGVESPDGGLGTQFLYNQARLAPYQGTTALRFTRAAAGPADTQPPAAPTGLTATAGELHVSLDWAANGEGDLAGYHVYRQQDGSWTRIATTVDSAYSDTSLTAGTPYTYRVTAFDQTGNEGSPSTEATATPTGDVTPPAVPAGLQATPGDGQVALDWADNTDPVAQYRVYRDGVAVGTTSASAYTDGGRTNGVTYAYRVTALDQAGNESGPSNEVSATPQAPPPPPPETNYRIEEEPIAWLDATAGGTRLTLGDDTATSIAVPFPFPFYDQTFTSVNVSSNGYLAFGSAATAYANTPLPTAGVPNGLVSAYWDDLNPAVQGAVWHRTIGTAPNRKLVVSWVGVRHYSFAGAITFQAVLEESTGDIVLAYQDTDHGNAGLNHGASASVGVESPSGALGTQFSYNQARLGPYQATTALRFTRRPPGPPDVDPPAAPTGLTATAGELRVSLDWAANGEDDLAGYHVYRRQTDGTWARIATTVDSAYTDGGLTAGTSYPYRVTAFDQPGNEGSPSTEASATPTGDVTPPAVPVGLQATPGDGQVALDWADNTDPVAQYRVYRNGAAVATVTSSSYADGGRTNGVTYTYRVTALDEAGNESGPSNEVSATPQAAPPPPPGGDYRIVEEPIAWIDASAGGTRLTLGDDTAVTLTLPFTFGFFGQSFTSVNVSSNGYLAFGSAATSYANRPLPTSAAPNGLVAVYWDDLNPAVEGAVWQRTLGSAPNRRFVVSYVGVRHYATAGAISFQVVLEEGTGDIVLAYLDTDHGHAGFNHGASASVGVESPDGSRGTQFSHNQARLGPYQGTTALRFTNR